MEQPSFFCEFCGAPVPRNASRCPSCGRNFDAVMCPSCGFKGDAALFKGGCPSCGYAGRSLEGEDRNTEPDTKTPRKPASRFYRLIIGLLLTCLLMILGLLIRRL